MLDQADKCSFGHQLSPGSTSIKITETDPVTGKIVKEEKLLLRNHVVPGSESRFDPTGLSPAECEHGLEKHPDPYVEGMPQLRRKATTWIRSKHLDVRHGMGIVCPVCLGLPRPDDLTEPRNAANV